MKVPASDERLQHQKCASILKPHGDVKQWRAELIRQGRRNAIAIDFYATNIRYQLPANSHDDHLLVMRSHRQESAVQNSFGVIPAPQEAADELHSRSGHSG